MKISKLIYLFFLFVFLSCKNNYHSLEKLNSINNHIENKFAPDKRVAVYKIKINDSRNSFVIDGETNSLSAYNNLIDSLKTLEIKFTDNVRVLPDSAVGELKYAVARNSVINIRSKPSHSSELGTQGLLGMPLKILDKKGDFYRVQTPDNYISWVDKGGITKMTKEEFDTWNASDKLIFTKNFGYVYKDNSFNDIISDISLGCILKIIKNHKEYYSVEYPDKRKGYVKVDEATIYKAWKKGYLLSYEDKIKYLQNNIEKSAKSMIGFPYLWGGTSSKGVDCSGFTKMVYLMNGYIIPRDASQQIHAGKTVDKQLNFNHLQKGDLLFFGKKETKNSKQKVTHVGIWLGNGKKEFIHSSGNVHISSMDENEPNYDEFNKNRYLGSKRYLGVEDNLIEKLLN